MADRTGFPLAIHIESASPHEVTLVEATLESRFVAEKLLYLVKDRSSDSNLLDKMLNTDGIDLTAPHRKSRIQPVTQDSRKFRRHQHHWKIERLNAWL